jgi:hypothetical protein
LNIPLKLALLTSCSLKEKYARQNNNNNNIAATIN